MDVLTKLMMDKCMYFDLFVDRRFLLAYDTPIVGHPRNEHVLNMGPLQCPLSARSVPAQCPHSARCKKPQCPHSIRIKQYRGLHYLSLIIIKCGHCGFLQRALCGHCAGTERALSGHCKGPMLSTEMCEGNTLHAKDWARMALIQNGSMLMTMASSREWDV